ncbi:putative WRKY transcription factor 40 [Acorus calamus]|uniref:WRKY transcription factor 40 n=1 Tax=Acorus calamus TaxID=4465 RepID=A0AAV9CJN1_ACOCL|nr:putative WRKY transcription factor 40 [Acorus calamus]
MGSSWIVDASQTFNLDLNLDSFRLQAPKDVPRGAQINFMGVENKASVKDEASDLKAELERMKEENKRLTETLSAMYENYITLQSRLGDVASMTSEKDTMLALHPSRKRKAENNQEAKSDVIDIDGSINCNFNNNNINNNNNNNVESSSSEDSCKKLKEDPKTKVSRVHVRTEPSDTSLVVKDGYQWRKYGQKVTRDNPCPRAYFRCSYAPACSVKKKVQRSAEDPSVLVATYEGEHNHPNCAKSETRAAPSKGASPVLISSSSASPTKTVKLDLTRPNSSQVAVVGAHRREIDSPEFQKHLVEQMASSLTRDPGFTSALAAAISGRIMRY